MEDGLIRVILMEDCDKTIIEAVNQCITNALGELGFSSKWAHYVHHTLVVSKDGGANNVAIAINVRLPDMLDGSLGLIQVVGAELVKIEAHTWCHASLTISPSISTAIS